MAMALAMVLATAMVDMDWAMEDMVDTVLDSMERETLSLTTMDMVTREAMDTDTEPEDTTTARGKLMPSLATMDITVTRGDTDTGPGATTTARGRPSLDMAIVMDTRDIPMAMVTVSTMDKKAES